MEDTVIGDKSIDVDEVKWNLKAYGNILEILEDSSIKLKSGHIMDKLNKYGYFDALLSKRGERRCTVSWQAMKYHFTM